MANNFTPFGFLQTRGSGSVPTYEQVPMKIAAANATAIFAGDAVVPATGPATGYIIQATAGAIALAGIFVGCKYVSVAQKRTVWGNYWPGSDANGDIEAYVINDPNAQFIVQAGSALNLPYSKVGQLAQLGVGTGNVNTGISGMFIASVGTTSTFPFRIVDVVTFPPGANGTDTTSVGNYVIVAFNNVATRSNGAVTGIS